MNKETELTLKLKGIGVEREIESVREDLFFRGGKLIAVLWDEKSALAWLREKGWKYKIETDENCAHIKIHRGFRDAVQSAVVDPGHELEGLLECMLCIVEGER